MSGERTKYSEQAILNFQLDDTVSPPRLVFGLAKWNGSAWVADGGSGVGTAGGKSLTDATTGVQLHAGQACSYVDISCHGGVLAIGNSASVNATPSAGVGIILTPGSTVYRVYCSNLNQIYVAGATGTRVGYVYH